MPPYSIANSGHNLINSPIIPIMENMKPIMGKLCVFQNLVYIYPVYVTDQKDGVRSVDSTPVFYFSGSGDRILQTKRQNVVLNLLLLMKRKLKK